MLVRTLFPAVLAVGALALGACYAPGANDDLLVDDALIGRAKPTGFGACTAVASTSCEYLVNYENTWVYGGACVVVSGTGLPTVEGSCDSELLNFIYSDAAGDHGFVLGCTDSGDWTVNVPAQNGPTTYQFVSRQWGNTGNIKNVVYAECSLP